MDKSKAFNIRVEPALHEKARIKAAIEGVSISDYLRGLVKADTERLKVVSR